jgi:hypothetical protein
LPDEDRAASDGDVGNDDSTLDDDGVGAFTVTPAGEAALGPAAA